jgi:hypothetical protein
VRYLCSESDSWKFLSNRRGHMDVQTQSQPIPNNVYENYR